MFNVKLFASLLLTFVLQISHVLSEFPAQTTSSTHQVSIRISADDEVRYGSGHKCSGILISNFTVLTSASCLQRKDNPEEFYGAGELSVAMGSLKRSERETTTFIGRVTAVKTHGRFNKRSYANNMAILRVDDIEFGVFPIFPVFPSNQKISRGLNCYVLGWKSSDGELTESLMQTNVRVVVRDVCNQSGNFPFGTFCSMENDSKVDTCVGEEGSGLICGGVLRGVVSKNCNEGEITQYTDVSQVINWIWLSHFNGSLHMIESDLLKSFVFSALDFAAYFINTPKIADDFEVLKFFF